MKTFVHVASVLAAVHLALAVDNCTSLTTQVPPCASSCIESAASKAGCTNRSDLSCQCIPASSSAIQNDASNCVISACGYGGAISALSAGSSICACEATRTPDPTTTSTLPPSTSTSSTIIPPSTSLASPSTTAAPPPATTSTTTPPPVATTSAPAPAGDPCTSLTTGVPQCASSCVVSAASAAGCTDTKDLSCQCIPASSSAIQSGASNCVISACGINGALSAISAGSSICKCEATRTPMPPPASTSATPTTTPTSKSAPASSSIPASSSAPITTPNPSQPGSSGPSATTKPPVSTTCVPGTKDCGSVASTAVPQCAQECFSSGAPKIGCDVNDYSCQCKPAAQSSLSSILLPCVLSKCPGSSLGAVIAGAGSVCACANATPTLSCGPVATGPATASSVPTSGASQPGGGGSSQPSGGSTPCSTGGNPTGGKPPATTCVAGTKDCGAVATTAVPQCAQACFASGAPQVGCGTTDYGCQCKSAAQSSLSAILIPCVAANCPGASIPAVIAGASSVCACASAPAGGNCPTQTGSSPAQPTGGNAPGGNTPGGNTPGGNTPGGNTPGGNTPGGNTPGGNSPGGGSTPVTARGSRVEIGIVAGVFGAAWLAAVAL